ncbi:type III secretion system inner membrane ring lipoprotein SctJ [Rhizosaccharibacter radicis]|uniref:Lipoprotein n=1 Tax=Rhizosaccharibacter radicis TaxID=2782605 RepID=A0ABT1VTE9_9PROT|nr:type III secretion inner membrane ring lipoprotein SctJ [Acetobacteraceae bacterium KSS12]
MRRPLLRSVLLCSLLALAACKTELYSALPEQEANEMIALLMQRNIQAEKVVAKDGTDTIMVDKSRFADAVTTLRDAGFPRKNFESMGDVFKAGGLVASPMQERARFLYALSQELSGTISQIDGVLSARVSVVLPEDDILDRNPTPSSASVFVRYDAASNVDKLVPQIKMLVADSVQGLSYDKVSVVLVPAARPVPPPLRPLESGIGAQLIAALAGAASVAALAVAGFLFRRPLQPLFTATRRLVRRAPPAEPMSAPGNPVPRAIEMSTPVGR